MRADNNQPALAAYLAERGRDIVSRREQLAQDVASALEKPDTLAKELPALASRYHSLASSDANGLSPAVFAHQRSFDRSTFKDAFDLTLRISHPNASSWLAPFCFTHPANAFELAEVVQGLRSGLATERAALAEAPALVGALAAMSLGAYSDATMKKYVVDTYDAPHMTESFQRAGWFA